jgi:hypothetical protein
MVSSFVIIIIWALAMWNGMLHWMEEKVRKCKKKEIR